MLKNRFKFIVSLLIAILLLSTFAFATDNQDEAAAQEVANSQLNNEIHEGDLYLYLKDGEVMDQLVNGNVFIVGNNVKVTGQIVGNLFICANSVDLEDAYVQASVFVCANKVNYKAVASDLYACTQELTIVENTGVYRNLYAAAGTLNLHGIIGRDAFVSTDNMDIKGEISGDLKYSSDNTINIPENSVGGSVVATHIEKSNTTNSISTYIISALSIVVLTFAIFLLSKLFAPNFVENAANTFTNKTWRSLGIGTLILILVPIITILLFFTVIGVTLGFVLLALYFLLIAISNPVFSIAISKVLFDKFFSDKKYMQYVVLACTSLVLWAITLIPYVSILAILAYILFGLGIIGSNIYIKKETKKEALTDE